ncbi:hypothetical protein [Limosilactobacillus fermentum]
MNYEGVAHLSKLLALPGHVATPLWSNPVFNEETSHPSLFKVTDHPLNVGRRPVTRVGVRKDRNVNRVGDPANLVEDLAVIENPPLAAYPAMKISLIM